MIRSVQNSRMPLRSWAFVFSDADSLLGIVSIYNIVLCNTRYYVDNSKMLWYTLFMTHAKTVWLVVGIVAVAIAGYFMFQPGTMTVENEGGATSTPQVDTSTAGKKKAFSEFMKEGGSYKCTVHQYVNDTDTQGTVYLDSGLVRGEYDTQVQGKNYEGTVVVRDGYAYMWSSMMPGTGFKSKVETDAEGGQEVSSGSYSFNANQIGEYDCQPWTADGSMFEIPADVTFREV
jgi:hypothetical protein